MAGRLTLSWANKDKALVADGEGGYEWVEPTDPRAREVRLLDEIARFPVDARLGDSQIPYVGAASRPATTPPVAERGDGAAETKRPVPTTANLLIRGDSFDALRALVHTPEYADEYRGKVKLVYIDPPFNTGQAFEHYDDSLEHSVWLGMMRERLVLIRELLAPDGSVWVHLDDAEMAYCKVIMDEIFGRAAYIATVNWQKTHTRENRTAISTSNDSILVYAPTGDAWKLVRNVLPSTDDQLARYTNPDNDARGPWQSTPMHAKAEKGRRAEQFYSIVAPNGRVIDPPPGRCWLFTRPRFDEMVADNRISFGTGEGVPRIKKFLSEVQAGLVPNTWWTYTEVGTTGTGKAEVLRLLTGAPFSTPKPERLLERIIHIGSNPGDIVLDCFAGSGTTAAVAHKMGRRWVTVELSESTVDTFTKPRLQKVVAGDDPGGVTKSTGWDGGGAFQELRVAGPSFSPMPEDWGGGTTVVANLPEEQLTRSVAAQLGFRIDRWQELSGEASPFIGTRGRARLAVVNGVADDIVVGDVVSHLADDETAVIAAMAYTLDATSALAAARPGSRILRIPDDLFPRTTAAVTR